MILNQVLHAMVCWRWLRRSEQRTGSIQVPVKLLWEATLRFGAKSEELCTNRSPVRPCLHPWELHPGSSPPSTCMVSYKVDLVGCAGGFLCSPALQWVLPRAPKGGGVRSGDVFLHLLQAAGQRAWPAPPSGEAQPGCQSTWAALIEVQSLLSLLTRAWSRGLVTSNCVPSCRSPPSYPNLGT